MSESIPDLADRARNLKMFKERTPFTLADVASCLKIADEKATKLMQHLADGGYVDIGKKKIGQKRYNIYTATLRGGLAYKSWRKHSDEELGIVA